MMKSKVLDWKPIPGSGSRVDRYAERAGHRWVVRRTSVGRNRHAVLRLNGAVLQRFETMREAMARAEKKALEMETVA